MQHDFNVANQGFPSFRSDLNSALTALASCSSGATAPTTPYADQLWYETDTNTLWKRNEANTSWISMGVFDETAGTFAPSGGFSPASPTFTGQVSLDDGSAAAPSLTNTGDTNTGIFFPAPDIVGIATAGIGRFYAGPAGELSVGWANYGTSGQVLTSGGSGAAPAWATPGGVPSGAIVSFAMSTAPSGWLKANGAAVSRTAYAALFAAIGTTFGAGDGSTTFNLPDLRGRFTRNWSDGSAIDSGRAFGSTQAQDTSIPQITQNVAVVTGGGHYYSTNNGRVGAGTPSDAGYLSNQVWTIRSASGAETRPDNIALLACIKY